MEWRSLPVDLQEEIISRVPAKSLVRLQLTSKQWKALLKTGNFAKNHCANAPKESLIIMLIDYRLYLVKINLHGIHNDNAPSIQFYLKDPSSKSSQVDIRDIFHCDGLFLCITKDNGLVVWNPCSGETKWIKPRNSYKESDLWAFGYHNKSSCKQYKVLRVDRQRDYYGINNEYEIYDFTSNSWSVLGVTTDWSINLSRRGVSVKGNTYFVAQDRISDLEGETYPNFLLSYDFTTEIFQSLSLPQPFPYVYTALSVVGEEKMSLLGYLNKDTFSMDLHVWVTTSIGTVMSWSKLVTVQSFHDGGIYNFSGISFLADEHNKVVAFCKRYWTPNTTMYFVRVYKHIQVGLHGGNFSHGSSNSLLMNYVPSLAQIQ